MIVCATHIMCTVDSWFHFTYNCAILLILYFIQIFSASATKGCLKMNMTDMHYQFQMSTVEYIGGEPVEGRLSQITAKSIVFVPKPGMYVCMYALTCTCFERFCIVTYNSLSLKNKKSFYVKMWFCLGKEPFTRNLKIKL